jgi:hypothetical protein
MACFLFSKAAIFDGGRLLMRFFAAVGTHYGVEVRAFFTGWSQ